MSHPSEPMLLAFADDELDAAERRDVVAHVARCEPCRYALRDLQGAMRAMSVELAMVDAEEPIAWRSIPTARRPRPARASLLPDSARQRRTFAARTWTPMRWAAAMLLVAAGGAAAMSVPSWRRAVLARTETVVPIAPHRSSIVPAVPVAAASSSAAVSVLASQGKAIVALTTAGVSGDARVLVTLSDRPDVQVTVATPVDAATVPHFISGDGRIEVQLTGDHPVVRIDVPTSLRSLRVLHDGSDIITVQGAKIRPASAASTGVLVSAIAPASR